MIFEQTLLTNHLRECMKISMENLFKDQGIFSLVIILSILITVSLDNVQILSGEN